MISKNIIRPTQIVINKNDIHDINLSHMSSIISVLTISKTKLKNKINSKNISGTDNVKKQLYYYS